MTDIVTKTCILFMSDEISAKQAFDVIKMHVSPVSFAAQNEMFETNAWVLNGSAVEYKCTPEKLLLKWRLIWNEYAKDSK